jgi:hypothetical protein
LIGVGVVVFVALFALGAWLVGSDDLDRAAQRATGRFASDHTTAPATSDGAGGAPVTTLASPTTIAPSTTTTTVAPSTTLTPTTVAVMSVDAVVPDIAAFPQHLATPEAAQAQIAQLLLQRRHDVASPDDVRTLCATVVLDGPLRVSGRWERNGQRIADSAVTSRDAPGYGECIENDGDPLVDGAYQFVATDDADVDSAAATFVVGAQRVEQRFVNDGQEPVCAVLLAPTKARVFEAYLFDARPIESGVVITVPVADVDQDVETLSCNKSPRHLVASFEFDPAPETVQSLVP